MVTIQINASSFPLNVSSSVPLNVSDAYSILKPLLFFVIGMALYSIFIFHFYRFLAKKDIFELDFQKYNTSRFPLIKKIVGSFLYLVKYIFLFPLFTFFWFAVLTVILTFLARDPVLDNIFLVSIAVVSAVRAASYYNEDLSKDLAKMLPFALLGVFLVDMTYFSFSNSYQALLTVTSKINLLVYYLLFAIVLEFFLRITHSIIRIIIPKKEKSSK